jgi:hypothetical protein
MRKQDKSRVSASCNTSSAPGNAVPTATAPLENDSSSLGQNSDGDQGQIEATSEATISSCGDDKGRVAETARPLRLQCHDCEELLHQLSNVITPILMHAQILEWKLPPYSHLKRSVRELERNARRGSELLKSLVRRVGDDRDPGIVVRDPAFDSRNGTAFDQDERRAHKRM